MIKKEKEEPLIGKVFISFIVAIIISLFMSLFYFTNEMAKEENEKMRVKTELMILDCVEKGGTPEYVKVSKTTILRCSNGTIFY